MHDTSPDNPELEALQARAEWELGCGRLNEAIQFYVQLLCRSWQLENQYFEGEALWALHVLDLEFSLQKLKKLRRGECKCW